MNNIIFRKVWHDETEPFCQIEAELCGNEVSVKTHFYVMDTELSSLSEKIDSFVNFRSGEVVWSNIDTRQGIEIHLFFTDKALHVKAEIKIIVDNEENHICFFYIANLDLGALQKFAKKLKTLCVGESAQVFEE